MYHGTFVKNGSVLFEADLVLGYIGVFTAFKPNSFSITLNERDNGTEIDNLAQLFFTNAVSTTYYIR